MKLLLILLGVVVATITLIVVVGALLPKRHVAARTVKLRATPADVFRLISGPQDWRTDLREYKFFDQENHHMVRETDTHGQTMTYEIVESRPPTLVKRTIADKSLPFGGSWTWNIQPAGQGSSVTITEDGEVYNPIFRFVSRFVMGHTRGIDNYLAMLEATADGNQAKAKRSGGQ
jgi:hypothetical protein